MSRNDIETRKKIKLSFKLQIKERELTTDIKQKFLTNILQFIDKGKGIDNRYKAKVFDKYFQISGSNKSGTGLGLAISKEFIEAQRNYWCVK